MKLIIAFILIIGCGITYGQTNTDQRWEHAKYLVSVENQSIHYFFIHALEHTFDPTGQEAVIEHMFEKDEIIDIRFLDNGKTCVVYTMQQISLDDLKLLFLPYDSAIHVHDPVVLTKEELYKEMAHKETTF